MENFGFLHVQSVSNDFSGKQINCTQTLPHGVHMCSGLQIKTKEPPRVVKVCVTHNTYLNCSSQPWQPQDSAGHHKQDANSLEGERTAALLVPKLPIPDGSRISGSFTHVFFYHFLYNLA